MKLTPLMSDIVCLWFLSTAALKKKCLLINILLMKSMALSISSFSLHLLNSYLWILRCHFFQKTFSISLRSLALRYYVFSTLDVTRWHLMHRHRETRCWVGVALLALLFLCRANLKVSVTLTKIYPSLKVWFESSLAYILHKGILNVQVWLPKTTLWTCTEPFIERYQNNSAYKALKHQWTKYTFDI